MAQMTCVTDRIVAGELCAGCGACAALVPDKVKVSLQADGFMRPATSGLLSRKETRRVMAACPGGAQRLAKRRKAPHRIWGSYESVHQGWAADDAVRHAGASGGGLSALLIWLLESGQIDGVLQVVADPQNPVGNMNVVSRTRADVLTAAASRYAPSAPLLEVPTLLETGARYAFVGKPCDVSALRGWARLEPKIDKSFPVMLSFFCAGIPSQLGAEAVAAKLGFGQSDLSEFRYRGQGWPGRTLAVGKDGSCAQMSYAESWGAILSKHVQPRCRVCADGIGLEADLVFADAWESDAGGYPVFEEGEGISLMMPRTAIGQALLREAETASRLVVQPFDITDLEAMQPGQVRRRRELAGRLIGRLLSGTPIPQYRGVGVWQAAKGVPFRQALRAALGMARRCILLRKQKS